MNYHRDPNDILKRYERGCIWVTQHLPRSLVTETERVGLSLGFIVVGITSLLQVDERGGLAEILPIWALIEWSLTLLLGGVFTIMGIQLGIRWIERTGIALSFVGCLTYGIALISIDRGRAQVVGVLFLALAGIKAIRFIVAIAGEAIARLHAHDNRE